MKKNRLWMAALLAALLVLCNALPAMAAQSEVIYEGDAQEFVFIPASTDLFGNFKGVMPGDTLKQSIVVRNDASKGVKVKIYLQALGVVEQTQDFLSQLKLKVVQQGSSVLFDAPADQTDGFDRTRLPGHLLFGRGSGAGSAAGSAAFSG